MDGRCRSWLPRGRGEAGVCRRPRLGLKPVNACVVVDVTVAMTVAGLGSTLKVASSDGITSALSVDNWFPRF